MEIHLLSITKKKKDSLNTEGCKGDTDCKGDDKGSNRDYERDTKDYR